MLSFFEKALDPKTAARAGQGAYLERQKGPLAQPASDVGFELLPVDLRVDFWTAKTLYHEFSLNN